jgi:hypothetical protein
MLTFSDWCDSHPKVVPYLTIFSGCCPDLPDSRDRPFSERRACVHDRTIAALTHFLSVLSDRASAVLAEMKASQCFTVDVPSAIYDSPHDNMVCRICGEAQLLVCDARTSVLSWELYGIEEKRENVRTLIALFQGSVIPDDTTVTVSKALLMPATERPTSPTLTRTTAYLSFVRQQVFYLPSPVWRSDFTLFLQSLIKDVELDAVPGTGYYRPSPSEVSLMGCLLTIDGPVKRRLLAGKNVENLRGMITQTVDELLMPIAKDFSKHELGIAQFVLYRNIFEICSVRRELWPKPDGGMIAKIAQLSEVPSTCFKLPEPLLARALQPEESIRSYILGDPGFSAAAVTLGNALFTANPLDALFAVYDCLTQIKDTANRNSEQNGCLIDEGTLSFDDTFTLFFAVFLASDLIDLPGLNEFVIAGAPELLSSTFGYSKTMLEALVLHIEQLEVDLLIAGAY